jgi:hypothetical protein
MTQVKIVKAYKKLNPGDMPIVDDGYADILIKKGVAENPIKKAKAEKE